MTSTRLAVAALALSLVAAVMVVSFLGRPAPYDPVPSLTSLQAQIDDLSSSIEGVSADIELLRTSIPAPADLAPLDARLDFLARDVADVRAGLAAVCGGISVLAAQASPAPAAIPVC